jgi:hypothetical protein
MRYIVMHKVDAKMEAGAPPDARIIQDMGALVQESLKQGVFLNGAGLHKSARRARVVCKRGDASVTRGPYSGKNELVAAVTMISTRSFDDAVTQAKKLGGILGEAEIEVGPTVEPWDLGLAPKPEKKVPENFLLLCKSTPEDEGVPESSLRHRTAVQELAKSLGSDGVVHAVETLAPSSRGLRLSTREGKRSWVDGPFAESKELIAGFSLLELPGRAEIIAWADRYAAILGDNEVDIREVHAPPAQR